MNTFWAARLVLVRFFHFIMILCFPLVIVTTKAPKKTIPLGAPLRVLDQLSSHGNQSTRQGLFSALVETRWQHVDQS